VETVLHGDVSALQIEAIPNAGAYLPVPVAKYSETPGSGANASGITRATRTGNPSGVGSTETFTPTLYVPRAIFRPGVASAAGIKAALHESNTDMMGLSNYDQIVTPEHIYVENDPVLGSIRKVMRLSTTEADTSLTGDPRTQLTSYPVITQGSEFWAGFSVLFPESPAFPASWNNSYFFTLAEVFGTPFGGTSPFRFTVVQGGSGISLAATKSTAFNATGSANVWVKPINPIRSKWLDIVIHGVLSTDPAQGYYELFTNEGAGLVQQTLNGETRLYGASSVPGINDGAPNAHHIKNYRGVGSGAGEVTVYFANHRVGLIQDEVNPRSYG
jgi:hypothetical protein